MVLISSQWNSQIPAISIPPITTFSSYIKPSLMTTHTLSFPLWTHSFLVTPKKTFLVRAKKRDLQPKPVLKPTIIEEVSLDDEEEEEEEEELLFDDVENEKLMEGEDDDYFDEEDYLEDDTELYVGDGAGGGGMALAGTWWDKEALKIAEEVCLSFDGELKIYAFKTLSNSTIQLRIERLTNKSGSPTMEDVEAFSTTYRTWLDEAELAKIVPENITLEVSSPGVERVVRIPEELDRFKDRIMYVKYISEVEAKDSYSESDGVLRFVSFDMETKCCTWCLADVRINREKAGKGRPLSKKQREWRLNTPFDSLRLVRLYSEI